jgi:hypothetical protein
MKKIKLLIADSGFAEPWFLPLWQEFFDVEIYDHDHEYDASSLVLTDNRFGEVDRYQQIRQHNYRTVLSYLTDSRVNDTCETINGELVLRARDWMWIQESVQWRHWNHHVPRAPAVPDKFFLLLMNLRRDHRDLLCDAVRPYLDSSLYSYVEKGILLPGDHFIASPFHSGTANDRLYVPDWYAKTCFSLVSESFVGAELFVSEKIFKPLAYSHPLIVYGTPGTLDYLHELGFETFGHVIDQSYDLDTDATARLKKIVTVLSDLRREFERTGTVLQDPRTQQILAHNHARFFDQSGIRDIFYKQVALPIMEFAETS